MTTNSAIAYPRFYLRFIAMIWDSLFMAFWFFSVIYVSTLMGFENNTYHGWFIVLSVVSFEPLFVYFRGGTLGHMKAGIQIVNNTPGRSLSILQCYLRLLFKVTLGFYSLIAMFYTNKNRAVHDMFSRSVVVFIDQDKAPQRHKIAPDNDDFKWRQVSVGRRLLVSVVYLVLVEVLSLLLRVLVVFTVCDTNIDRCGTAGNALLFTVGYIGLAGYFIVFYLGAKGKLFGAKRRKIEPADESL